MLFSYLFGVLLYRLWSAGRCAAFRIPGAVILALLPAIFVLAAALKALFTAWVVDVALVATVIPTLLLSAANASLRQGGARFAGTVGSISYPLYAIHIPVLGVAVLLLPERGVMCFAVAVSAALLAAITLSALFEPSLIDKLPAASTRNRRKRPQYPDREAADPRPGVERA